MNGAEFIRNCNAFDPDELARYENQHVAWSEDGRKILAHADTLEELSAALKDQGLTRFVLDFVPSLDGISLGGGLTDVSLPSDEE